MLRIGSCLKRHVLSLSTYPSLRRSNIHSCSKLAPSSSLLIVCAKPSLLHAPSSSLTGSSSCQSLISKKCFTGGHSKRHKKKVQEKLNKLPSRGDNGRFVMTEERWDTYMRMGKANANDLKNAKQTLHKLETKLNVRYHLSHLSMGPRHRQVFLATMKMTVLRSILQTIPSYAISTESNKYTVKLMATGAASRKIPAESFATMDLLLQLQECGVDINNPPNLAALQHEEAKERQKQEFHKAQMLLELCSASKPMFDTWTVINTSYADVSIVCRNQLLTASASGNSKVEAERKAIIAAAKEPLEQLIGSKQYQVYQKLVDDSPSGHVAALWISPLSDEAIEILSDSMGYRYKYEERMKQHQARMTAFQRRSQTRQPRLRNTFQQRNVKNMETATAMNATFLAEEQARLNKALEDPNSRQGIMKSTRDALSIKAIREDLLDKLKTHSVVVVSGGTGSGKSTQCPQYILEDAIANGMGPETRIVVTQPRRIAAISVAERVAEERDERLGNSVGYAVRFNREAPREAGGSIEFVTTGVLLRRLMNDPVLDGVSHVMIDEVHERDINTDFLLVLLKELLTMRSELRVVLMSATLDAESFGAYFSKEKESKSPVPVMSVPAKPFYPVDVIYLEDMAGESSDTMGSDFSSDLQELAKSLLEVHDQQLFLDLEEADAEEKASARLEARSRAEDEGELLEGSDSSDSESDSDNDDGRPETRAETLRRAVSTRNAAAGISSEGYASDRKMADKREIGEMTVTMVAKVAEHVANLETNAGRKGSILCFLPGWDEIKAASAILEESGAHLNGKMKILPLHSTIPKEDQHLVFEPAEDGTVKVILATTIAESSVTINDVLAVVDSGVTREMNYDAQSAMSKMETVPTSRASATQRLGRAGRVAPGKCYRIYSRGALQAMLDRPMPEIQRTALEATCLQTCSITSDSVANFLRRAMDPPPEEAVSFAMERLVNLGAINVGTGTDRGEWLTPVGQCLSRLPLDPAMGRMLIMGCVMMCLDPVLTAAACISSRPPFYSPLGLRKEARLIRQSFSDSSDLMATVRAYNELQAIIDNKGWEFARRWASENFISLSAMSSIRSVRSQLLHELHRIGFVPNSDLTRARDKSIQLQENASVNQNGHIDLLCSAVWATGLPGNLSSRRRLGNFGTFRTRMEEHAGLHPSSVVFHRKPPRQRGINLPHWFAYHEMVLSSQLFLRGNTALEPEQILLFGANPKPPVLLENGTEQRVLDDWIVIEGRCQHTINLLWSARHELNTALEMKVLKPREPLPEVSQSIIDAVCYILEEQDDYDVEGRGRGGMMDTLNGSMHIEPFKAEPDEMFEREGIDKSHDKSKKKKDDDDVVGNARYKMPSEVRAWLRTYIAEHNNEVSPKKTAELALHYFAGLGDLPEGFPTEKQLRSAVSSMKITNQKKQTKDEEDDIESII